jgi:hypothetical protein
MRASAVPANRRHERTESGYVLLRLANPGAGVLIAEKTAVR